jgi:ferredoxin-NADP reductase
MARAAVRGRLTWQVAQVSSVLEETDAVRTIELEVPDWPGHRAGQHLDVRLTADDGYTAERSYSIATADGEPVAITVERLEDGEVSPYLTGNCARAINWSCAARSAAGSCGTPATAVRCC